MNLLSIIYTCDSEKLYDPLAQLAEHLTFNQGVRSSNLRWVTKTKSMYSRNGIHAFLCAQNRCTLTEYRLHYKFIACLPCVYCPFTFSFYNLIETTE